MYCTEVKLGLPTLAQCCSSMPDLIPVEPFQFLCIVLSVLQWSGCLHNSAKEFSSYNQYYLAFPLTSVSNSAPCQPGQQKVNQTFNVMQSSSRNDVLFFFFKMKLFNELFRRKLWECWAQEKRQTQTELRTQADVFCLSQCIGSG